MSRWKAKRRTPLPKPEREQFIAFLERHWDFIVAIAYRGYCQAGLLANIPHPLFLG